jgi:hypothetical protein
MGSWIGVISEKDEVQQLRSHVRTYLEFVSLLEQAHQHTLVSVRQRVLHPGLSERILSMSVTSLERCYRLVLGSLKEELLLLSFNVKILLALETYWRQPREAIRVLKRVLPCLEFNAFV